MDSVLRQQYTKDIEWQGYIAPNESQQKHVVGENIFLVQLCIKKGGSSNFSYLWTHAQYNAEYASG